MQSPKAGQHVFGCAMPLLPAPRHWANQRSAAVGPVRSLLPVCRSHRNVSACSSAYRQPAPLIAGLVAPAALQLAVASPAQADDPIAAGSAASSVAGTPAGAAVDSAAGSLITLTNAAPDDPVITVLFYFAITVLSVVTLGVAYLAITGWLDDRKEKEDRTAFESAEAQRQVRQDREKAAASRKPPKRRTAGSGKGGGKGFS